MEILKSEALEAITKSEIDIAIATAKRFPRDVERSINMIRTLACQDKETAEECFYSLPRGGKPIIGPSARLAEIVTASWGNINAGARIISNDGKMITAQAVCHDLETNVRITMEVQRRITDKSGKTFNEDMQIVTSNAASSIALRNAVFKVVPKALTKNVVDQIMDMSIGKSLDIETSRNNAVTWVKKLGVTEEELCAALGIETVAEIGREQLIVLNGLKTALKDGDTTVEETFKKGGKSNPNSKIEKTFGGEVKDDPKMDKDGQSKIV